MAAIPTVTLSVPAERDYMTIMERTKMVYDQLLRDKNAKLVEALVVKKQEYDVQCSQISAKSEAEAIEFGVRAQEYLIRQQNESELELKDLQADYQAKLDKMADQMETQWRQKLGK